MSDFFIEPKISSLLKTTRKPSLLDIDFVGTGGAFDFREKNSSMVLKTNSGSILVDCGSTVYSSLCEKKIIDDIDYIFITHCHEDHIGSLSTLVFHKFFSTKKPVKIECLPSIKEKIEIYLKDVCGHIGDFENSFSINSNEGTLYKDLNAIIYKIDTTGFHFKDIYSSGFVFNFRKDKKDFFVLYSGDINVPFTEIIKNQDNSLYNSIIQNPENVFVFHDATIKCSFPNYPHFDIKKSELITKVFRNFFVYHISKQDADFFMDDYNKKNFKFNKIAKKIDDELAKKTLLTNDDKVKEALSNQAKKIKLDIADDLDAFGCEIKFVETFNGSFKIQQKNIF